MWGLVDPFPSQIIVWDLLLGVMFRLSVVPKMEGWGTEENCRECTVLM
jgi:hypothetical protein